MRPYRRKEKKIEEEAAKDLLELEMQTQERLEDIRNNELLGLARRQAQIERVERDSARRRTVIERRMAEERKQVFKDMIGSFITDLNDLIARQIKVKLAEKITDLIFTALGSGSQQGDSTAGKIVGAGLGAAIGFLASGGNPQFAISGAGLGASLGGKVNFDSPRNDAIAFARGRLSPALIRERVGNQLSAKSASDFSNAFASGFEAGASGQQSNGNIQVVVEMAPMVAGDFIKWIQRNTRIMNQRGITDARIS